jgi:hypothetical protein
VTRRRALTGLAGNERGATLVEFAFVLPDTMVRERLQPFSHEATITTSTRSYLSFSEVGQAEPMTIDNAPFNVVNVGDCWKDYIVNNTRDLERGRTGVGQADDVVQYTVSISFPRLFPIHQFLGWPDTQTISHSTLLSNQPYAGRSTTVPIACRT